MFKESFDKRFEYRLDRYLSKYYFQSNNIDFRIVSSKALEKFKNVQTFQLSQLVNGNFFFSAPRREILLLKYDLVNLLLNEVEHLLIDSNFNETTVNHDISKEELLNYVDLLIDKTHNQLQKIIFQNADYFDLCFVNIWQRMHELSFNFFKSTIREIKLERIESYFVEFVDKWIMFMEHTLIEIHELNNILHIDKQCTAVNDCSQCLTDIGKIVPVIYVTDLSINYFDKYNESLGRCRIELLKEYITFDTITIKNHSNSLISCDFLDDIENVVNINYKESIISEL